MSKLLRIFASKIKRGIHVGVDFNIDSKIRQATIRRSRNGAQPVMQALEHDAMLTHDVACKIHGSGDILLTLLIVVEN